MDQHEIDLNLRSVRDYLLNQDKSVEKILRGIARNALELLTKEVENDTKLH